MTIHALIFEPSELTLWGLDPEERLHRQLNEIGKTLKALTAIRWIDDPGNLPTSGEVLLFNGGFIFENRTVEAVTATKNSVLQHEGETAAAFVEADLAADVVDHMRDRSVALPEKISTVSTEDFKAFDINLRRSTKPLLEPVSRARKAELSIGRIKALFHETHVY